MCRGLRSLTHSWWHGAPASVAHPLASSAAAPHLRAAVSHIMPLRAKARSHLMPLREKRAKARSHLVPLRRKAREGEESPDAPAQKSVRRRGVTWCPCAKKRAKARSRLMPLRGKAREGEESPGAPARRRGVTWCPGAHPISLPDFAGLLRQLFTPLRSGVQLGRIA